MYVRCLLRYKYQLVQVQARLKTKINQVLVKKTRFHKKKEYNTFSELSHIWDCIVK